MVRENVRMGVAIVATAGLMSVLMPIGAQAAGTLMTIVDDNTASKAQVVGGRLSVGDGTGRLTTEGRTDRLLVVDQPVDRLAPITRHVNVAGYSRVRLYAHNDTDSGPDVTISMYSLATDGGPQAQLTYRVLAAGETLNVIHDVPGTRLAVYASSLSDASGHPELILWGRS